MKTLFLHGWQSVPGGVKPTCLVQHGHEVINPKLPDDDFEIAVRIAQAEFDKYQPQVVVGSSRGGAVVMKHQQRRCPARAALSGGHLGIHLGQLSTWRQMPGLPPLF